MKKSFFLFISLAFVLGFMSCNKDEKNNGTPNGQTEPTEPTYNEGVYAPLMKVSTITYEDNGNNSVQTWTWDGNLLTEVNSTDGDGRHFTYDNTRVTQVSSIEMGVASTISFTYSGNQLSRCMVNESGEDVALLKFRHGDNKISGADVAVDINYITGMLGSLMPGINGKSIKKNGIKLNENEDYIHVDLIWDGKNISQMRLHGEIPFELTKDQYQQLRPMLPIDESVLSMIDLFFMMSNALPLQIGVSDTIDYTYDNGINPFYCYLGDVTPSNLSLNNVTSALTHGKVALSVNLTGNPSQVLSQPIEESEEYRYTYNEKKYPTKVEGTSNYSITYK